MDREIEYSTLRKKKLWRAAQVVGVGAVLAFGFMALRGAIAPSIDLDQTRLATVERGDMAATIDVAGTVVPRNETVVSASFATEVRRILAGPGTEVEAGDPLLALEHRPLDVQVSELEEELALKENDRKTRGLELDQSLSEAQGRQALLKIDLESRKARQTRYEQLAATGAISKGELHEAELDVRRTEAELAQLSREIENERQRHAAELERIDLEASILRNRLAEQNRLRELATVRAPHAGVVTWVVEEPGASVALGSPLARVADLSAYRVEANVSDFYAQQVAEGQPARVRVGDRSLDGQVGAVLPAVEQGSIRVLIDLLQADDPALRPQLRVDIEMITDRADDTLFVKRGPGVGGRGRTAVYRVAGDSAVRTPVTLGFSNRDRVQVLDGLAQGDQVVISETSEFSHLETIQMESKP